MNKQRAFPLPMLPDENWTGDGDVNGMLLRDYFAIRLMTAVIANGEFQVESLGLSDVASEKVLTACAGVAYQIADAMLQERDK